jgi:hypothetical protein
VKTLETELSSQRSLAARFSVEVELERARVGEKERESASLQAQVRVLTHQLQQAHESSKTHEVKAQQLSFQVIEKDEEIKQLKLKLKELKMEKEQTTPQQPPSKDQITSPGVQTKPPDSPQPSSHSLYFSTPPSTLPSIEKFQVSLRQRDGEILSLQSQIANLEKLRGSALSFLCFSLLIEMFFFFFFADSLQDELVNLTAKNESM